MRLWIKVVHNANSLLSSLRGKAEAISIEHKGIASSATPPLNGTSFVTFVLVAFILSGPVSQAWATTYPGYTGTNINDGTRLNGLISAPFPDNLQVNTLNGNLYHTRVEEVIPGRGLPIELSLSYNTLARLSDTAYGVGWTFSYNIALFLHSNGDMSAIWADGRIDRFGGPGPTFTAPPGVFATLVEYAPGKFLLTTKRGMKFFFDAPHKMVTCMRDPSGNALTFIYNGNNLLITITEKHYTSSDCTTFDATGRSVSLTYNGNNKLATITDPASRIWSYAHNPGGDLTTVTDPLGNLSNYSYDSVHRLIEINDARPEPETKTTITYANPNDFSGGTISRNGTTWSFTRDVATLTYIVTDTLGHQTRFTYDSPSTGRIIRVTDALINSQFYTWDSSNNLTQFIDRNGRISNRTYDTKGNVLTRTEAVGTGVQRTTTFTYEPTFSNVTSITRASATLDARTTNFTYNAQGLPTSSVVDPGGLTLTTTYTYDGFGQPTSTTNPRGFITTFTYNSNGNLTSQTVNPGGLNLVTSFTYDAVGNQLSTTDANGHVTCNQYDALNRLSQIKRKVGGTNCALTAPGDVVTSYTYDPVSNRLTETDPKGTTTTFAYDSFNRVENITDALTNQTKYGYHSVGNRIKQTDANNEVTCFKYDALNRLTQTIRTVVGNPNIRDTVPASINCATYNADSDDAVTSFTYDAVGNQLSTTDPNGNTSTSTYDALNRVIAQANALGETTSFTYDLRDNQKTVTLSGGDVASNTYDKANRLTNVTDSVGAVSSFTYDANGNRLTSTDGNGNTTTFAFDAADRLIATTDALGNSTIITNDGVGNQLAVTDRNGKLTCNTYDDLYHRTQLIQNIGDTLCSIDSNDIVTTYAYDKNSNQTSITDANGNTTSYTYDALNRLTAETYADTTTRSFNYDAVGNRLTRLDQNGNTTSYTYDDLYRLKMRDYPGTNDDNFSYDKGGRMLTATNSNASITYTYDNGNRTTSETLNAKTTSYSYDIPNRKRSITYPGARFIVEMRDLRERLNTITEGVSTIGDYNYDVGNRITSRTLLNGVNATYTYNANNWVTKVKHAIGVTTLADFQYNFDNEGNRKFQEKLHDSFNSEEYAYDDIYRVTTYKQGTLSGGTIAIPSTQTQYNYDRHGSRTTTVTDSVTATYTSNNMNEYTSINGFSQTHDNNGNLTNDGVNTYAYDTENRLISVNGGATATYKYDSLGRREQKISGSTTINYYFDGSRVIEERDASDTVVATYVYGVGIDEVLQMVRGGNTYYYHQTSLLNIEVITDSSGAIAEAYRYDAYGIEENKPSDPTHPPIQKRITVITSSFFTGSETTQATSAIGNPYVYTGREYEPETGLYYYRARYYNATTGRFIQRDPLGNRYDSQNLYESYAYVSNNPINLIDPIGLSPALLPCVAGAAAGLIINLVRGGDLCNRWCSTICGCVLGSVTAAIQVVSQIGKLVRPTAVGLAGLGCVEACKAVAEPSNLFYCGKTGKVISKICCCVGIYCFGKYSAETGGWDETDIQVEGDIDCRAACLPPLFERAGRYTGGGGFLGYCIQKQEEIKRLVETGEGREKIIRGR